MQKILIISYFFYPCNLTAAHRTWSWQLNMPKNGLYPIVLTRHWTGKELTEQQRLHSCGEELKVERFEQAEVHYLPYKASIRDKMFMKASTSELFAFLSRIFTFFELVLRNVFVQSIPYNNIYFHAREVLKKDTSIKKLIISGNPFEQFYFGYLLKKEFPHISWVADYRDEWTTNEINKFGFVMKSINWYNQYFEKKWMGTAALISGNTKYASKKLYEFHNKKTITTLNGFYLDDLPKQKKELAFNSLTILHNGTLYPTQKITLLRDALARITIPKNFEITLKFPGILLLKKVANEVAKEFEGIPVKIEMSERISQLEVFKMQLESDIMLMVAHENVKGTVGSKLYEYIGLKKPVLLCPSDNDELEATLEDVGLGIIINEERELVEKLEALIAEKREKGMITLDYKEEKIAKYNRENQVSLLVKHLKEING